MSSITVGGVASIGSLVGTIGHDSLLRSINNEMNATDFFNSVGDILSKGRESFAMNVVRPIRLIGDVVKNIVGKFDVDERYIPITSADLMQKIPTCMHSSILHYQPIRKLFEEGRIFGFGHVAIPDGDPYGRLIKNGTVEDVRAAMDDEGWVDFEYMFKSTDPELSFNELESIRESREYIDKFLEESDIDFTDPVWGNQRG